MVMAMADEFYIILQQKTYRQPERKNMKMDGYVVFVLLLVVSYNQILPHLKIIRDIILAY